MKKRKLIAMLMALVLVTSLCACSTGNETSGTDSDESGGTVVSSVDKTDEMTAIEEALNLANMNAEWTYSFNTDFQKQMAEYLAAEYMEYINGKNLSVSESSSKKRNRDLDNRP